MPLPFGSLAWLCEGCCESAEAAAAERTALRQTGRRC